MNDDEKVCRNCFHRNDADECEMQSRAIIDNPDDWVCDDWEDPAGYEEAP